MYFNRFLYPALASALVAVLLSACGGGGSTPTATGSGNPGGLSNVLGVTVDAGPAGPVASVNVLYTTVKICKPGDTQCQTIDHVMVDTPGVHGVALANELGKGYTSNGRDNSITVFDLKTLKTLNKVKTVGGENPDFIVYDGVSRRVLALNGKSHNASVIDAANDQLLTTIALTGKPEAAVADGNGRVFVNIEDRDELATIDMRKGVVTGTWSLPGCHEPAGLAIDTGHHRLFVGCHNRALLVVDSGQGRVVATLPIGEGVDANAFDAASGLAFSSQGDGTLSIVKEESADTFSVQQTATTQHGARTMALNPNNHRVYLVSADFEETPATTGQQRPRRVMKPNSFALLVMGSQ